MHTRYYIDASEAYNDRLLLRFWKLYGATRKFNHLAKLCCTLPLFQVQRHAKIGLKLMLALLNFLEKVKAKCGFRTQLSSHEMVAMQKTKTKTKKKTKGRVPA